ASSMRARASRICWRRETFWLVLLIARALCYCRLDTPHPAGPPRRILSGAADTPLGYHTAAVRQKQSPINSLLVTGPVADQCAHAHIGKDFQQHRVRDPSIDDVGTGDAALDGIQGAGDFWQHAAIDGAVGNQLLHLRG